MLPSGKRVILGETTSNSNRFPAIDGSGWYLFLYPGWGSTPTQYTLLDINGTRFRYTLPTNGGIQYGGTHCDQIRDRNGNYITIAFRNLNPSNPNGYRAMDTITDTLGRVIRFNYDAYYHLISITQSWGAQTHTWATFEYSDLVVQTNYGPFFGVDGPQNGQIIPVLSRVILDDGTRLVFVHNSWAQVQEIRRLASLDNQLSSVVHLFPSSSVQHQWCPRFYERRDLAVDWMNGNNVSRAFSYDTAENSWGQVTLPNGTVYKEFFGTTAMHFGLTTGSETWVPEGQPAQSVKRRWTTLTWNSSGPNFLYYPYVQETSTYEDIGTPNPGGSADRRKRTRFDTSQTGGVGGPLVVTGVEEYDADGQTPLRYTTTDYISIVGPRIMALPLNEAVYEGSPATLISFTGRFYDAPEFSLSAHAMDAIQHESLWYSPSNKIRGNLNRLRKYEAINGQVTGNYTNYSESTASYYVTGSLSSTSTPTGAASMFSYGDQFSDNINGRRTFAYLTSVMDPDGNFSQNQYHFDHGRTTFTRDALFNLVRRTYDGAGRLDRVTTDANGAYTQYAYAADQRSVTTYTTIETGPLFGSTRTFDGHGRMLEAIQDHPGSAGGYSVVSYGYDNMGLEIRRSNPTETNVSFIPTGDDLAFFYVQSAYDWKGRVTLVTNQDGSSSSASYDGCGCAGSETATLTDEVGRRQRIVRDVLGRIIKEQALNSDGSAYLTTTKTWDARNQPLAVKRYAGDATADGSCTSPSCQQALTQYDGYGRVATTKLPSADLPTQYEYYADSALKKVTDARGATTTYTYNNRRLVTSIVFVAPSGVTPTEPISFGYDGAGNRLWASQDGGLDRVDYVYNTLSQLISETRRFDGLPNPYALSYAYNLGGQLTTVTDQASNTSVGYPHNRAGGLTGVTGSGYSDTTNGVTPSQFATGIQYRAWGALKALSYGNGAQVSHGYNPLLQATSYTLSNLQIYLESGQTVSTTGSDYEYFADKRLKFASDRQFNQFDRAYEYDSMGRIAEALSGREARGLPPSVPHDNPYRQSFTYDAQGNMSGRSSWFWRTQLAPDSAVYVNDRRQGWTYDAAGNITHDGTGDSEYDVTGLLTRSKNWLYFVGGGETTHEQAPGAEIEQRYDADGQVTRRVQTRRTETLIGQGPQTTITVDVTTTYYLRSTVLGGATIAEFNELGQKGTGYIYGGEGRLVKQTLGPGTYSSLRWEQTNPLTGSQLSSDWNRVSNFLLDRKELDPLGAEVEVRDPYQFDPTPTYPELRGTEPFYIEGGDPFDLSGGCTLDGMPISCSQFTRLVQAGAVQTQTSFGLGDVYYLGNGTIGYDRVTGLRDDGEGNPSPFYAWGVLSLGFQNATGRPAQRPAPARTPSDQQSTSSCGRFVSSLVNLATKHWLAGNSYTMGLVLLMWGRESEQKGKELKFDGFREEYTGNADAEKGQKWSVFQHVLGFAGASLISDRGLPLTIKGARTGTELVAAQLAEDWHQYRNPTRLHPAVEGLQELHDDYAGIRVGAYLDAYLQGYSNRGQLRGKLFKDLCSH